MERGIPLRRLTPWVALLGLVIATILVWQGRFAAVEHPLNGDAGFEGGFDGWFKGGGKNGLRQEDGATVARFARPALDGEFNSATRWFGPLEGLRYLHVGVEAKWSDAVISGTNWTGPRLILMSKDPQNRNRYDWDLWVYVASGTRDWQREEAVFMIEPGASEVGLAFQMPSRRGNVEVRKLRVSAVRTRAWIPAAAALLIVGWMIWLAGRLRGRRKPASWWRVVPASSLIVVASWYLVFPGPGAQCRPLVGSFLTGTADPPVAMAVVDHQQAAAPETPAAEIPPAVSREVAPATEPPAPREPRLRVIPQKSSTVQPARAEPKSSTAQSPPPSTAKPAAPPKPPGQPSKSLSIRNLDLKLDLLHILPFFGLSLGVLLIIGTVRPWPLLSVVALLSEVVPNWCGRWTGVDDLLDVAANIIGVALGIGAFVLIHRLGKRLPRWRRPARPA